MLKVLNDSVKGSLYKAVVKYQDEVVTLNDESRKDVSRIIAVAKSLGFEANTRDRETVLLYNGQWYVSFYCRENKIVSQLNEYELLTGKALEDFIKFQEAEAHAEQEADRGMSMYNSGYRNF